MQLPPSPALADVVRHYLIIEYASLTGPGAYRFFPDGSPGIVFSFAEPLTGAAVPGPAFVYGQASRHSNLTAPGKLSLLVVVLQPWGLHELTGVPGAETTDLRLSPEELFGKREPVDRLAECVTWPDRIRLLERWLADRCGQLNPEVRRLRHVMAGMTSGSQISSIRQLAEDVCLTERTLERRFDRMVGLSPKAFFRILRLQKCLKMKRSAPDLSLTEVAYQSGFYDQAHFIRECIDLSGMTPGRYLAHPGRLAANFLPV